MTLLTIRLLKNMFNWLKRVSPAPEKSMHGTVVRAPSEESPRNIAPLIESEAHKKRGNEFLGQGRLEDAVECYRLAISINPGYAEGYLNLGFALNELALYEEAKEYLKQAILLNPKLYDAYYLLGVIDKVQGQVERAIENFNKALEFKPDFEMVYGDLFNVLLGKEQYELAEGVIRKGISYYPDNADFQYFLGNLYAKEGKLDEAKACFLKALLIQPDYIEVHGNLGYVLQAKGQLDEAIKHYLHALKLNPDYAEIHNNLGNALQVQGRLDEALGSYYRALALKPELTEAHFSLLSTLQTQGNLNDAIVFYQHALSVKPDSASLHGYLGNVLQKQGKLDAAVECFRQALTFSPNSAELLGELGWVLQEQGKLDDAFESLQRALLLKPELYAAHRNLIGVCLALGKLDQLIGRYRQTLSQNPDNAIIHECLGYALRMQGKLDEALVHYRQAISLKPHSAELHNSLGYVLQMQGRLKEAIETYRHAILLKPDMVSALNNLGEVLQKQGKYDEAITSLHRAISLSPEFAEAHNNLGHAFQAQGKLDDAMKSYLHALSLRPDFLNVHGNLLFLQSYHPDYSPEQYLAEARKYGRKASAKAKPYTNWSVRHDGGKNPYLKIGLVSGDLKNHPVGFFLESILKYLNPEKLELVAYPTQCKEDLLTARLKSYFAAWKPIEGMNDEAAARMIHEDGIHILIDLAGHTSLNRLPLFAWRAAPVQVSWLGYFASTGVSEMDFLLADPISVPDSLRDHFTETVWHLPDTRLCFSVPETSTNLVPAPLPAIRNGYITFGCFQKLSKINNAVLALWGRIFGALPQARLRLQNNEMNSMTDREKLLQCLARVGIDPDRVTIKGAVPREDYLAAHAEVDIILDTFPYPGGTTTCEALWMGVPTLTLAGNTLLARQGASLLACAGLEDWIASHEEEYVSRTLAHAADLNMLAQLRLGLREKVLASPLFDAFRFAGHLEDALQGMWHEKMGPS